MDFFKSFFPSTNVSISPTPDEPAGSNSLEINSAIELNITASSKERIEEAKVEEDIVPDPIPSMSNYWNNVIDENLANQYTYDYCFVCSVVDNNGDKSSLLESELQKIINSLKFAGLHVYLYYSCNKSIALLNIYLYYLERIFVLIGATEKRLVLKAATTSHFLSLNPLAVKKEVIKRELRMAKVLELTKADPENYEYHLIDDNLFNNLYAAYELPIGEDNINTQYLYQRHDDGPGHTGSLFSTTDRLKLIFNIFESEISNEPKIGGCGFELDDLINMDKYPVIKIFPIHNTTRCSQLEDKWKSYFYFPYISLFNLPIEDIKNYLGEKVAFFHAFYQYYSTSLIFPSILGLGWGITQFTDNSVDINGLIFLAMFMSIWSVLTLEFWKRWQNYYSIKWGQDKFDETELVRPHFIADHTIRNPIDGSRKRYFTKWKSILRSSLTGSVILTLAVSVCSTVVGIFLLRAILIQWNGFWGGILTAFVNAIQILILNSFYKSISLVLTDFENHKTDTEYNNALISKSIVFKFQYDTAVGGCINGDCLAELQTQLGTIFLVRLIVENFFTVIIPLLCFVTEQTKIQNKKDSMSQCELESRLEQAPESSFEDFDSLAIQYGYVTLFVVAFPLAPCLALLNNVIKNYTNAIKSCKLRTRPIPFGGENIGNWFIVFDGLSGIAVLTNICIIIFQSNQIKALGNVDYDNVSLLWIGLILEHFVFLIKVLVDYFVPDVDKKTDELRQRNEYLVNVLLKDLEEDDDDELDGIALESEKQQGVHLANVNDIMVINNHTSNCSGFSQDFKTRFEGAVFYYSGFPKEWKKIYLLVSTKYAFYFDSKQSCMEFKKLCTTSTTNPIALSDVYQGLIFLFNGKIHDIGDVDGRTYCFQVELNEQNKYYKFLAEDEESARSWMTNFKDAIRANKNTSTLVKMDSSLIVINNKNLIKKVQGDIMLAPEVDLVKVNVPI